MNWSSCSHGLPFATFHISRLFTAFNLGNMISSTAASFPSFPNRVVPIARMNNFLLRRNDEDDDPNREIDLANHTKDL